MMTAISSGLSKPLGLALDPECKDLYIADSGNNRVLGHVIGSETVTVVAGDEGKGQHSQKGSEYSIIQATWWCPSTSQLLNASAAIVPSGESKESKEIQDTQLNRPSGLAIKDNMLYVADSGNKRVSFS